MIKTIFKILILITISIMISCSNENSDSRLSENEKLQVFDIRYLTSENGEYLTVKLEENSKNVFIDYNFYINQSTDRFGFDAGINDGYVNGEAINDKGTNAIEGNLSDAGFNGKIDNKEINFVNAKSSISGAKEVRYSYTNISPVDNEKTFEYYSSIFLLNNDKKSASIDKINLDINSDMTSDKLDINKLSNIKNIISNDMFSYYSDWVESEYPYYSSIFRYGIDYLSDNVTSINRYYYLYIGGAHGIHGYVRKVYSLSDGKRLRIEDILINVNDSNLINKVKEKLLLIADEESYHNLDELHLQDNNFYITSKGLIFTWEIYEIAPYSMGNIEVLILSDEILPYLKDEYKNIFE